MDQAQQEPGAEGAAPDASGKKKRGGLLYKLALASVGGVILAQEEITSFFRRDPGQPAPESGEALDGVDSDAGEVEPSEPAPPEPTPETADWIDATINQVLKTLSVATRGEVQSLQHEVDDLSERIAALRSSR